MEKKIRIITIAVVLFISAALLIYWFNQYKQRSKASTIPTVQFDFPAGTQISAGQPFDLLVEINPHLTTFYSFNLTFTYDVNKVAPKDLTNLMGNITAAPQVTLLTTGTSTSIATGSGIIKISGIRQTGGGDPFMGPNPIPLATVSFIMKPGATLPFSFKWDATPQANMTSATDTVDRQDLTYTGLVPTAIPTVSGVPPVGVPTSTPVPSIVPSPVVCGGKTCPAGMVCYQPTSVCPVGQACPFVVVQPQCVTPTAVPTPTSVIGGPGAEATTTSISARADTLYINSISTYPAPFRYEQPIKLEKGNYNLTMGAKVWVKKGSGLVLVLQCNEATCGSKKQNDIVFKTLTFPVKPDFSELSTTISIPDEISNHQLVMRIFCEDGSECEIDYISIQDVWGSERVLNPQFAETQQLSDPRKQPSSWQVDATANLYGSIDPAFGNNGALMINNPAK